MKRLIQSIVLCCSVAFPASAQNSPVIVELFTSQGCSSCPPADAMMEDLALRDDIIALSLHVDYWDYIGWKDEFAVPGNAKRQRAYAMTASRNSIFTPEMIVNGDRNIVGAKPMELATAVERYKNQPRKVAVNLARKGGKVVIEAEALMPDVPSMTVQILRYQPVREARITRGENAGRTIHYVNVTQDWKILRSWDGKSPLRLEAGIGGEWPVVVLIQTEDHGPILAAAQLK